MAEERGNQAEGSEQPYRRIAADLRIAIEQGEYRPGHQLPSGSVLMKRYDVARQTVQNAIDLLRVEGWVVSRPGAGVFVRDRPVVQRLSRNRLSRETRQAGRGAFLADAEASGFTPAVEVVVRFEPAGERIADALDIEAGDEVTVRQRIMSADGQPVQLAVSRLPRSITAGTAIEQDNPGPTGIYGVLDEAGHTLDHFVESVSTRPATQQELTELRLAPGTPVLAVTRVAYDSTGRPVEINDMVLVGDRYELVYEFAAT
ncbi:MULTISPECIES: GntR family transcriptional regulator [unclassified Crossiella]|uniref:GntR family transcriptional regulator n=1 Tax=unclassified Crossiella TaxID=2620835 RepID=UPI001FFF067C|nr:MULTISPECIES: GntR family transcriptional regulator [unclassified Crossiella]MCK2238116.1 GntR family transcriptional regulator [Crossiella sp. S99.2]MCK2256156.1 GntR family transcriptional regulator [Crossiella sp. S99.1]